MRKPSLIDRLLGRNRRRPTGAAGRLARENSLTAAQTGDVIVLYSDSPHHDDPYLMVERVYRYTGGGQEWKEIIAANSQRQVVIECQDTDDGLFVTAATDRRPLSLEAAGLNEPDLITLDEEHSIGNGVIVHGKRYSYRNSFEAFRYSAGASYQRQGFYLWEFMSDDGAETLAVTKSESTPFEVYIAQVIDPAEAALYPGERPEPDSGPGR